MPIPRTGARERYNRKWTDEQKLRIVKECLAARAKDIADGTRGGIAQVLQKYNLKTSFLTIWKHEMQRKGLLT